MAERLMLIGWEAADWRILHPLIDSGKMPELQRIVEHGASGTLLSSQPLLSAPQWTSLITGKRPWQHGVCHQSEFDGQRPVPISVAQRNAVPIWDMLGSAGKKSLIVGWPATQGARSENALLVSNRYAEPTAEPGVKPWPPAAPGTYWPTELGRPLDALRVSPEDLQADLISHYIPDWQKIDQKRDRRLGQLRVFLAADLSHQAAMLRLLSTTQWDFAAVHFPALGPISALFLPFCAPKREWVPPAEFQIYQHVLNAACMVLDRLLRSLVQAAGKETTIVLASAHGVNLHLPPQFPRAGGPDAWKSPYGILTACGPRFRPDALIFGATIQDVTPTLLTWFGLPIAEDMAGRVLIESFTDNPAVTRLESWENEGADDEADSAAPPTVDHPVAQRLKLESEWNRALSCLDAGRYEEALPLLTHLFRSFPERADFGQALFQCQLTLKKTDEAAEILGVLLEAIRPGVWSLLLRLELELAQRKWEPARRLVEEIQRLNPTEPEALRRLGMSLWRLREWRALAELSRQALQRDENEPLAWLGLAEASLRLGQKTEAAEAAQRAIALNYFLSQAHLVLARSLLTQGQWAEAREAIRTVLRLQPNNRAAELYSRRTGLADGKNSSS